MSNSDTGSPSAAAKARLTEQEKKANHILSEKKRRDAIRAGFDRICASVPNMEGQGRSEALVLGKTVEHLKDLLSNKAELENVWVARGGHKQEFNALFDAKLREARENGGESSKNGSKRNGSV